MLLTLPLFTDKADHSTFCCMLEEGSVSGLLQRSSNFTKAPSQEVEIQLIGWTLGTRADLRRGEALWNHHTITYLFCTTIILDNRCEDQLDLCALWTNLFGACSLDRFFYRPTCKFECTEETSYACLPLFNGIPYLEGSCATIEATLKHLIELPVCSQAAKRCTGLYLRMLNVPQ
jgi:hypothetical protein